MKKLTLLFVLAFIIQAIAFSQPCFPDGITFTTQAEIDNFQVIHPNPFSTSTTIEYHLKSPQTVTITIYNHLGKQVEVIRQQQSAGQQQIVWNAEGLPSGVYYYRIQAGEQVASGKMMFMK